MHYILFYIKLLRLNNILYLLDLSNIIFLRFYSGLCIFDKISQLLAVLSVKSGVRFIICPLSSPGNLCNYNKYIK